MISRLRGTLVEKSPAEIIVEAHGVGYGLQIPVSTFTALPEAGSEVQLHVYTHVREDAFLLYGFSSREEKGLFEKLISVSGIGPKLANTVLSGLAAGELIPAIQNGKVEQLVRIPGVGKKTAERMVLELRDKLSGLGGLLASTAESSPALSHIEEDVLSALLNLGCTRATAETAIRKAKGTEVHVEFEPLFRRALDYVR